MNLRIISWNINSVRFRLNNIARLALEFLPDIICLQETKVINDLFPFEFMQNLGYKYIYCNGQKSYHGVATLSKFPLTEANFFWDEFGNARNLSLHLGDIELHNFYMPAGGDIPDIELNPKFKRKFLYFDYMTQWFNNNRAISDKMIIVGDLNIAPFENDVWSHKQLLNVICHTPMEVATLKIFQETCDWQDIARHFVDKSKKLYSWWSYRNQDWRKSDRGRRLDHIWVTKPLLKNVKHFEIIKDYRDIDKASDHVPVMMDIEI